MLSGNIVLPEYQRLFVWNKNQVIKLIESFEKDLFVPPVTIGFHDDGNNQKHSNLIIDGQQRLTSILLAFLGLFPNTSKFKTKNGKDVFVSGDNDDLFEESEDYQDMLEWRFPALLKFGSSKQEIIEKIDFDSYEKMDISRLPVCFFDCHYLGFSFLVPDISSTGGRQKSLYFSSVFRDINCQGIGLTPQESREALYYFNESSASIFKPAFAAKITIQRVKMDFVRYLSLLSDYAKHQSASTVAHGFKRKMEDYYADFILFVSNGLQSQTFEKLPNDIISRLNSVNELVTSLSLETEFDTIIRMDLFYFGLLYYLIFSDKKPNGDHQSLKDDIENAYKQIRNYEFGHVRNPSAFVYLRGRITKSIDIYTKYVC